MDLLSNNSKYIQINLSDIIKAIGEDGAKSILSSFSCPNKDVENFLRYKAIEFSKRDFSKTHLVFWSTLDETEKYLVGYYTIAPKFFLFQKIMSAIRNTKNSHNTENMILILKNVPFRQY